MGREQEKLNDLMNKSQERKRKTIYFLEFDLL